MASRGTISKNDTSFHSAYGGLNLTVKNKIMAKRICSQEAETGKLTVLGGQTTLQDLLVNGSATFLGDVNITGSLDLTELIVTGDSTLEGDLNVAGNTTLQGDLLVQGDTTLQGDLEVAGDTSLGGDLIVAGNTTLQGDLTVEGDTSLAGDLFVSGDSTLQGDLTVQGDTSLAGDLFVAGDTTLQGNLTVGGDITFNGDVTIVGGTLTTEDICITDGFTLYANAISPKTGTTLTIGGAGDTIVVDRISTNFIDSQSGAGVTITTAVNVLGDLTVQGVICSTLPDSIVETNILRSKSFSVTLTLGTDGGSNVVEIANGNTLITENLIPDGNNTRLLGTTTARWATLNAVDISATGTSTLASVDINGGTIDGTVIGGAVPVTLTAVTADINGGTIDSTVIGGTTPAAGTFTTLSATTLVATSVDINGGTIDGVVIGGTVPVTLTAVTADINGGTIDATVIGGTTPAAGDFTDLSATSATLTTADINGGTIDGTTIGGTTPAGATFTSVVATTADINGGTIDGTVIGGAVPVTLTAATADINGGTIDGTVIGGAVPVTLTAVTADINGGTIDATVIGGNTPAAGDFTDLSATSATLTVADINGGTIDNTIIGGTTPAGATFTQVNVDNIRIDGNTIDTTDVNGNLILGANGTGDVVIANGTSLVPNADNGADLGGVGQRFNHLYARRGLIGARVTMTGNRNLLVGEDLSITGGCSNSIVVGRFCTLDSTLCCNAIIASQGSSITGAGTQNCVLIGGGSGSISGASNSVLVNCNGGAFSVTTSSSFYVTTNNGAFFDSDVYPLTDNVYTLGDVTHRWTEVWANNGTIQTSDRRYKTDIEPLEKYGLQTVMDMKPVLYDWKAVGQRRVNKKNLGFLADEFEDLVPEAVFKPSDKPNTPPPENPEEYSRWQQRQKEREEDLKGMHYHQIIPVLVKAIQELKAEVDQLKQQLFQ